MTTLMQKVINKYKGFLLVSIIMFLPLYMSSALSQEPSLFTAGAGAFDIFDDDTTAEFRFEYIFPERQKIGAFTPFIGFSGTANSGSYVYSGIGLEMVGRRLQRVREGARGSERAGYDDSWYKVKKYI